MAKVLCVLYDDPVNGHPSTYARSDLPHLDGCPGGQTLPTPTAVDFTPGHLLGCVSGELGLRRYLESQGHRLRQFAVRAGPVRGRHGRALVLHEQLNTRSGDCLAVRGERWMRS